MLVLGISLTGCGGEEEPRASDSPPPTAAEIAYYDCLKKEGVAIVHTDYGAPRVDKSKPWNEKAHKACEPLVPPVPSPQPVSAGRLAAARKESTCLRAEGVSWYPDPDPVTGEVDPRAARRAVGRAEAGARGRAAEVPAGGEEVTG
ncbi:MULTISPECIES: hypothetical protein [unclassified Streptomyces]|uniref:hypothetical protein n=1 Tax=unclassified Streptomyces TaxID=2593676 RepID=UPI0022556064|nr:MULTISPECIES: hypothetical protein [unclassified Streptomyces]MCX4527444.1 hypothetical protein [Streptomyces sp. NBC_01551]MCX4541975.1 hypothetical protein [Streptomyces sp. NBC_01565]